MRLEGKTALITGGASGFGEGMARRFHAEGANVMIADIDTENARRVAHELDRERRDSAASVQADVSRRVDVNRMIFVAVERFGKVDILVNNAGHCHVNKPFEEVGEEEFDRIFAVNVKSIFLSTQKVVPIFREMGGGVILNIASTAGVRPRPGLTVYNASKGAAITMTKSLAAELAADKIRVVAINPVMGETGMLETFMGAPDTPENRERFVATIPLGRMSQPRDVANAAVYLCSDEADFMTGVAIEVDGGRCV